MAVRISTLVSEREIDEIKEFNNNPGEESYLKFQNTIHYVLETVIKELNEKRKYVLETVELLDHQSIGKLDQYLKENLQDVPEKQTDIHPARKFVESLTDEVLLEWLETAGWNMAKKEEEKWGKGQ